MEIRRSLDRLISTMGFPILVRCHPDIESGSCTHLTVKIYQDTSSNIHIILLHFPLLWLCYDFFFNSCNMFTHVFQLWHWNWGKWLPKCWWRNLTNNWKTDQFVPIYNRARRNVNHVYIDGLVQDCSNSNALAIEMLQSCTKPMIYLSLCCKC